MPPDSLRRPGLFPIALDRVLEYVLGIPCPRPAADEYYHAACYGAYIAGLAIELHKLLAAAVYNASATKMSAGQRFGSSGNHQNDRNRDKSGSNRDNFKTARLARETAAPRTITFARDTVKDSSKGKTKAEASTTNMAE
eukprot:jgi/Tetstr1/461417/TSEL_006527.t1